MKRSFAGLLSAMLLSAGCASADAPLGKPEANQPAPAASASQLDRTLPVLFLVGDSTVHNTGAGLQGWGDAIGRHFDSQKLRVENRARPGRSSRTFQTQGWWSNVLASAKSGDFVMIQMGHNDGGPLDDTNRARGTISGLGEETRTIYNPLMKREETVHTYGWYLRKYTRDAREKGMIPIICSPVPRLPKEPVVAGTAETNRYARLSREVALQENVPFIDLNLLVLERYAGLSPADTKSKYFTALDGTHTSPAGAEVNAECVVEGLRRLPDCPLGSFLKPQNDP
jgi:rhamnogalacturonan acetylesterase